MLVVRPILPSTMALRTELELISTRADTVQGQSRPFATREKNKKTR